MVCEIQVRTVLQHVWAQIEHGMQYKASTALPTAIKRKFTSLAGLLEIGDREFQAIEDNFDQLKDSVKLELEDDLTKDAFDTSSRPVTADVTNGLNERAFEILNVRTLIADGRYLEAIEIYNTKIANEPKSLTLYLGRAKAKFLHGDIAGAKQDLQLAEDQQLGNAAVFALKEKLIEGNYFHNNDFKDLNSANEQTNQGHEALKKGDGELAYLHYSEAAEHGASRPFTVLNKAMACILANDYVGARHLASSLQIRPGTPMEINILGLTAIIDLLEPSKTSEIAIDYLTKVVEAKGDFLFALSPLTNLKIGLQTETQQSKFDLVKTIFTVLGS